MIKKTFLEEFLGTLKRARWFLLAMAALSVAYSVFVWVCPQIIARVVPPNSGGAMPVADTVSMVLFSLLGGALIEFSARFSVVEFLKTRAFGTLINFLTGALNGFVERMLAHVVTVAVLSRSARLAEMAAFKLTETLTVGSLVVGFVAFLVFQLPLYRYGILQISSLKRVNTDSTSS
jgi:hypothetical protein